MSQYKRIEVRIRGVLGTRYLLRTDPSGRFTMISEQVLPARVKARLEELEPGTIFDDNPAAPPPIQPGRQCLFCEALGTRRRFVHLQVVFLCEEHYHNKTTGETGQKIRELQDAQKKETAKV